MCRVYGEYPGSKRRANEFSHIKKMTGVSLVHWRCLSFSLTGDNAYHSRGRIRIIAQTNSQMSLKNDKKIIAVYIRKRVSKFYGSSLSFL